MSISIDLTTLQLIALIIDYSIKFLAVGFVPEGRRPSSSTAWLLAILLLPIIGLPLFLLMGSPYINRRRHRIQQDANQAIEDVQSEVPDHPEDAVAPEVESIIKLNRKLTGFPAVVGHNLGLHADYDQMLHAMVAAIDQAEKYIYVEVYIQSWDEYTEPFYQALARARRRGVEVKILVDQIGSFKYRNWRNLSILKKRFNEADFHWHLMLPISLLRGRFRRPDLRNHRKIIVIDGEKAFVGSANLIRRTYKGNKRFWIDYMVELSGPIVISIETVFAVDWYTESDELLQLRPQPRDPGISPDSNYLQYDPLGPGLYH